MRTSNTFAVHFWLNAAKQNKGKIPLYARVTVNGKRAEISLKRSISLTYSVTCWDSNSSRLSSRAPDAKIINSFLDRIHADLLECYQQLISECKLITAQAVKARFIGQDVQHKTLMELIDYHNLHMLSVLKPGTMKNYYTTERYIKAFLENKLKTSNVYLKQLSYKFIIDFEHFLRTTPSLQHWRPLENNGVMKHLSRLKKIINLGMKLEWLEKNPFIRFKLKFKKYDRAFLNKEELEKLETAFFEKANLELVKDIFIFSCYTGLAYSDVKNLKEDNIVRGIDGEHWIFTSRAKTESPVKIPLLRKALALLRKYEENPSRNYNHCLLPVYSNQKVNSYLKDIARELNINKPLSFHAARHTFATTVTLSNGVPIETVSKLLGHKKLSTTQTYARVMEQKISEDMKILRTKIDGTNWNKINVS